MPKRRVFISHYKGDSYLVDDFIEVFANTLGVFTPYVLGANDNDDFINSSNTDYVMSQVRYKYLQDSTVTIVLIGRCTHSRRYVDWEIKSSLQQGETLPNGLLGILVDPDSTSAHLPPRFEENWDNQNQSYARYYSYPQNADQLSGWIEDAYSARTMGAHLIKNPQEMMKYNRECKVCGVTH